MYDNIVLKNEEIANLVADLYENEVKMNASEIVKEKPHPLEDSDKNDGDCAEDSGNAGVKYPQSQPKRNSKLQSLRDMLAKNTATINVTSSGVNSINVTRGNP